MGYSSLKFGFSELFETAERLTLTKCCARGRPIIVEWERDARHSAGLSLVRQHTLLAQPVTEENFPRVYHELKAQRETVGHEMDEDLVKIARNRCNSDRIRSEDIRSITKVEDIIKKIRQLKWRWTGHMTRGSRIKWTKILTEWQPRDGTRKRGRQAKRWMDDMRKIGKATWSRKARDREEWKRLEEAYVSQDTLIN
ncbi:Putative uncharacterized transposon-derived protein F52C9.6 [Eumeta japonica]|uniref:Uncharacterized transposon-derived protein F52C9.6 n=1 Tax=Eumeta variegata TaxID=151549 RepID=A0A4C1ZFH9_EUMVA|nr:Putative uncharacterized transposon-derived protein F52C9.6 [Eumeta japonica]